MALLKAMCIGVAVAAAEIVAAPVRPWMHVGDTPAGRARALLANMTIDDKIAMVCAGF